MKRILLLFSLFIMSNAFAQKVPSVMKTSFSKEALAQKITDTDGKTTTISKILEKHKGKVLVIDLWASWCRDCLNAMPKAKELEEKNTNIDFVFLSLDRNFEAWKKGLEKHNMQNKENYWFNEGWKNNFNNYIDLNWIPRYLVINQKSEIAKYYAITPEDPEIQKTIDELSK
ncbi:TlpA family protein disulfide reductase [Cloacibacterium rupense]|nr:thioredoxin family protein [Cloacibacterium rupense]